jgi:hypothetical protein
MATLYYNGAVDTNWATLGNWWMDNQLTIPATSLPTSIDNVVLSATCNTNSGSEPTVVNLTLNGENVELFIAITVTGVAVFSAGSFNSGPLTGNATFNDSVNSSSGIVTGNATFNGSAYNGTGGIVTGNATFNDSAYNNYGGTVTGDVTFNDSAYNNYGTVTGDATFNDSAYNYGTVNGDATFNGGSLNEFSGIVNGNATFRGSAYNKSGVIGNVILAYEKGINGSSILGIV